MRNRVLTFLRRAIERLPNNVSVGRLFGVKIKLHVTLFIFMFGFATGGLRTYFGFLSLMICVLLHEFGHILMGKYYKMETEVVYLTPLGGMAGMDLANLTPWREFFITLTGPLVNAVIAVTTIAIIIAMEVHLIVAPALLTNWLKDLVVMNVGLCLFNLLPMFPMDGGRLVRSMIRLAKPKWSNVTATRIVCIVCWIMAPCMLVWGAINGHYALFLLMPIIAFVARQELRAAKMQEVESEVEKHHADLQRLIDFMIGLKIGDILDVADLKDAKVISHAVLTGLLTQTGPNEYVVISLPPRQLQEHLDKYDAACN